MNTLKIYSLILLNNYFKYLDLYFLNVLHITCNYIKLEFFFYVTNENNFLGGFILFIYNALSNTINSFNNFND